MNRIVQMNVSSPEQFIRAIRLSQNVFQDHTVINVANSGERFAKSSDFISEIQYGISSLYDSTAGSFAGAQLSQLSIQVISDPFGRFSRVFIDSRYFSSPKEFNDLICVSAEIANLLNKKVKNTRDEFEKIYLFDRWVRSSFEYKSTSKIEDHKAIDLLKTRSGVCQAIAAIAVLVLTYMGIKVLYITGEGRGRNGWGPHAWNAAKINGRWIHLDFTFSMNSLSLPSTKSRRDEILFVKTHRWDIKEYRNNSMNSKWKSINWLEEGGLSIDVKSDSCLINGVEVKFSSKLLIKDGNRLLVDLTSIIRLLGGGIELIPSTGVINVCVCNKRITLNDAYNHFYDGYFDQTVLTHIWKNECPDGSELKIAV